MGDELSENASTAVDTVASIAGATIGLVAAGPAGALVRAGAAPVVARVGRGLVRHLAAKAETVLEPAIDGAGGDPAFDALIAERPDLAALAVRAVASASQSLFAEHVQAMAFVLRDAVAGDVNVEPAADLIEAIRSLDAVCVVVLQHLATAPPDGERDDHWDRDIAGGLDLSYAATRRALAAMELTGAASSIVGAFDGGSRWRIEPLGIAVLDYLAMAAASAAD